MTRLFDKDKIKENLTVDDIQVLLQDWGGEPVKTNFGLVSRTICHNPAGEGSRKLYYYSNSHLFHCFTGCADPSFDIFELYIKVNKIQKNIDYTLTNAIIYIANYFGLSNYSEEENSFNSDDWEVLKQYERIQDISYTNNEIVLKEYDSKILDNLNYKIKLTPWLKEGIRQEILEKNRIGYYLGGDQITIPHFDKNNRFIGLRGRSMCKEDSEYYGKYRPISLNGILYTHPLGMNLYNFNNSKDNIGRIGKAIVFEGEKSALLYASYFGIENDISVACCGSSLSSYQIQSLLEAGAQEVVIAFDRQFIKIGDEEFIRLKNKLLSLRERYNNFVRISFIFDKNMITGYKSSPIDEGPEKFLQLFKERIIL